MFICFNHRVVPLLFCFLFWSIAARGECVSQNWEKLRKQLNKVVGSSSYPCSTLKQIHRIIPFTVKEDGNWFFLEERAYRKSLQKTYGIHLPQDMRVYGKIVTDKQLIVIAGFQGYGVEWPIIALAQGIEKGTFLQKQDMPKLIGEGAEFENIGIFDKNIDGQYIADGKWISFEKEGSPIYWKNENDLPNLAKQCLRCEGWLCRNQYIMCVSDFNQDSKTEYIFNIFAAPGGESSIVWGYNEKNELVIIHDYLSTGGTWSEFEKEWIFIEKMWCKKYFPCEDLGNAGCYRPSVYRYMSQQFKFVPDKQLQNILFPIQTIVAPEGCKIRKQQGELFYTDDNRWLLVKPQIYK